MEISPISVAQPVSPTLNQTSSVHNVKSEQSFGTVLKDAINSVNEAQNQSDLMTNKLVSGQDVDLSDVMITAQKASVTLNTALQVRNKAVEAYQEIMRMTV